MTKEEREVMQMALGFVASISPAFICEATHHKKNERHADNKPCPHVAKQKATYEAIEKCLANDALEKKAENARELGLNYEPEPVAWEQFYPDMGNPKLAYLSPTESPDNACYIPPQRKPLTDEEIEDIWADCPADWDDKINVLTLARAIEAAHGIKENT